MHIIKGFSLIEAIIAVSVVVLIILGVSRLITSFPSYTLNDLKKICLIYGAISGVELKRANPTYTGTITLSCGAYDVIVEIRGSVPSPPPYPGSGNYACSDATITARINSDTYQIRDVACNFGG